MPRHSLKNLAATASHRRMQTLLLRLAPSPMQFLQRVGHALQLVDTRHAPQRNEEGQGGYDLGGRYGKSVLILNAGG